MSIEPTFPPLLSGVESDVGTPAFEKALMMAARGCDGGTIVYRVTKNEVAATFIFAPDVVLVKSLAMFPLCGVGLQNALGALAPPEVAVQLEWDGQIRINAAKCGRFQMAASDSKRDHVPDWLVVGFSLPLWLEVDDPGRTPDQTSLYEEGCADIDPFQLIESWSRHSLVWINSWEQDGVPPLHREWRGMAYDMGEDITLEGIQGKFVGVDEDFGLLLRKEETTKLYPLSNLLKDIS